MAFRSRRWSLCLRINGVAAPYAVGRGKNVLLQSGSDTKRPSYTTYVSITIMRWEESAAFYATRAIQRPVSLKRNQNGSQAAWIICGTTRVERRHETMATKNRASPVDASAEVDVAVDLVREAERFDREGHLRVELLVAAEASGGNRFPNRFLDLTLGRDADLFEELARRYIEPFFVHTR